MIRINGTCSSLEKCANADIMNFCKGERYKQCRHGNGLYDLFELSDEDGETTGEIFYRLLSNPYFLEVLSVKDIELYGFEHDGLNDNQLRRLLNETEKELKENGI